jgi:ribosomal protein S18 acetylase RimI-like enzyme
MSPDLIYRMDRREPYPVDRTGFFFVSTSASFIRILPVLWRDRGPIGAFKVLGKVLLRRCVYFGLADRGRPLSTGTLALGYCRVYAVQPSDVVIGEIVTDRRSRGEGHATRAVMLVINEMMQRGKTSFWIDTQLTNLPMIRSIEKLGFGPAVAGSATGKSP